jgi:hypothetical protein
MAHSTSATWPWARETAAAIQPWSISAGGYINYMQADEPVERVRAAFGGNVFERLQALKRRYDPTNVLHRNQNIPPPTRWVPMRCQRLRRTGDDPGHRLDRKRRRGSGPRAAQSRDRMSRSSQYRL